MLTNLHTVYFCFHLLWQNSQRSPTAGTWGPHSMGGLPTPVGTLGVQCCFLVTFWLGGLESADAAVPSSLAADGSVGQSCECERGDHQSKVNVRSLSLVNHENSK